MIFPETVLAAIRAAVEEHPDDIQQAVVCAEEKVKHVPKPDYEAFLGQLYRTAIQELVYRSRSQINGELRRDGRAAAPTIPRQKVDHADPAIKQAHAELYGYFVAGRTLGSLFGEELEDIAASEQEQGDGHHFRARLLRMCRRHTPDGKKVMEAIRPAKLRKIWDAAEKGGREEAA